MGSKLRRTVEKRDLRLKGLKEPSRQGPAGQTCRAEGTPSTAATVDRGVAGVRSNSSTSGSWSLGQHR